MRAAGALLAALLLGGCSLGHYAHLLRGHLDLLSRREPITGLLAAPDTPERLRQDLRAAMAARAFAIGTLRLPDNGSYTQYADLGRPFVQWSVLAAPELSLEPRQWCYPFAGCFAYVGYYDEALARAEAASLAAAGFDTHVGGVTAYSTLGWFDDPVLNTMTAGPPERLAGLLFHELAHQRLHVGGDTAFNESYAAFVEQQGLREYLRDRPDRLQAWQAAAARRAQLSARMLETRTRLEQAYAGPEGDDHKRRRKGEEFARLRADYEEMRRLWGGDGSLDGWFQEPLNNARLLPFALYQRWVPAFARLHAEAGSDWEAFYRRCESLARLAPAERQQALQALLDASYDLSLTTKSQ